MVDIAQPLTASTHVSKNAPHVRLPYMVEVKVTAEQMIAAKGGAIAAADVYDVIRIPAGTILKNVWIKKSGAFAGTSADLTLDVGVTGVDADYFVDGWEFDNVAVGDIAAVPALGAGANPFGMIVDTAPIVVSVLVATQTGTWTGGEFRVYAEMLDLSNEPQAGIVQLRT